MRAFFEMTFGPAELEVVDTVLEDWRVTYGLPKGNPDVSLAAAVIINLFREGNDTVPSLKRAVSQHKGLADLLA